MSQSGRKDATRFHPKSKRDLKNLLAAAIEESTADTSEWEHEEELRHLDAMSDANQTLAALAKQETENKEFDRIFKKEHLDHPLDLSIMTEEAESTRRQHDHVLEEFQVMDEAETYSERLRNFGI